MKLYYHYDKEGGILYFSQGKPSAKDQSRETSDDVVLRIDPKTARVKGFTILNFSKRTSQKNVPVSLPIKAELTPA